MNNKILYLLLYKMLRIRMVEEKIAELYPEQEMRCPTHLSIGEEATAVGVCENLKNTLMTLNKILLYCSKVYQRVMEYE